MVACDPESLMGCPSAFCLALLLSHSRLSGLRRAPPGVICRRLSLFDLLDRLCLNCWWSGCADHLLWRSQLILRTIGWEELNCGIENGLTEISWNLNSCFQTGERMCIQTSSVGCS